MFGAASRVFGYEVDGLDYTFENGLPFPTGADGAPDGITILAMSPATLEEHSPEGKGQVFHDGTCEWVAGLKDNDPYVEKSPEMC